MSRPRLLDLFCGAGGASVGYRRASFDVTGVDLSKQPDYPFDFIQGDAVEVLSDLDWVRSFDAVHASPPCQGYTSLGKQWMKRDGRTYPMLYEPVLEALQASGVPYVIENPAARPDVILCGAALGLWVFRHRNFELGGWSMAQPAHVPHDGNVRGYNHGKFVEGDYFAVYGNGGDRGSVTQFQDAMDIHWTNKRRSITEAIPPAYTQFIGAGLLASLGSTETAVAA